MCEKHLAQSSKSGVKRKYVMLRVSVLIWLLYLIYVVLHIVQLKPMIFMNINLGPYITAFSVSLVILTGALLAAMISRFGRKNPELLLSRRVLFKASTPNPAQQEISATLVKAREVLFRRLSFVGLGVFTVVFICAFLSFLFSAKDNPMYRIYQINNDVEGFSYSEDHGFDLEFYSDMRPSRTEFFYIVDGDFANHTEALAETFHIGFDQIIDGQRTGGVSWLTKTYVEREADNSILYMRMPTENETFYEKAVYSKDYPFIIKPAELLSYLTSADYVRAVDLYGIECELYKTTIHSSSLENYFRADLDRYMGIYDNMAFYIDCGLADGSIVPLDWWMLEEPELYKGNSAGVEMSMWIEKEHKRVFHVELDATALGEQLIKETFGETAKDLTVSYLGIEFDYKDYGKKDISISEDIIAISS